MLMLAAKEETAVFSQASKWQADGNFSYLLTPADISDY